MPKIVVNIMMIIVERGRFVLNKTYNSSSKNDKKEEILISRNTEIKAKLHKAYLSHWVLKDLVNTFLN